MLVTNQTTQDIYLGPLHLGAGVGTQLTVDDTSATSLYLLDDSVADVLNNAYNAGKITVSGEAQPFPRPTGVPQLLHGDGDPEGLVFAPQGSLYMRRDGTGGNTLYVKTTGVTFNTGWQPIPLNLDPIQVVPLASWPPASPADQQMAILELPATYDPIGGKKFRWMFSYDSASSEWVFLGGPPLVAKVDTSQLAPNSATYVDGTTVGPTITLPLGGDYLIGESVDMAFGGGFSSNGNQGYASLSIGGSTPVDADGVTTTTCQNASGTGITNEASVARTLMKTGLAASTVIKMQYRVSSANNNRVNIANRYLTVTPVRTS